MNRDEIDLILKRYSLDEKHLLDIIDHLRYALADNDLDDSDLYELQEMIEYD